MVVATSLRGLHLSTDEQGGAQPSCLVFGTAFAGHPHVVDASIAGGS